MLRQYLTASPKKWLPTLTVFVLVPAVASASPQDQYYSGDLFTAIEEARQRTHHYDYSQATRYNRSTSQSIPIPRLLNQEMAQTIIKAPDALDILPETDSATRQDDISLSNNRSRTSSAQTPDIATGVASPDSVRVSVRAGER